MIEPELLDRYPPASDTHINANIQADRILPEDALNEIREAEVEYRQYIEKHRPRCNRLVAKIKAAIKAFP